MSQKKYLIVIAGPTAVGKTSLSIDLAKKYNSEIVSADSRQFFRELEIGTAKPSTSELSEVKHHFINNLTIHEPYDAGRYAVDAEKLVQSLFLEHDVVFLVGGSGLYIKALCDGLDEMPEVPTNVRVQLNQQFEADGIEGLLSELEKTDPEYFEKVDRKNPQRIIRALEVIRSTGIPYSSFRAKKERSYKNYEIIKIGVENNRENLYHRIDLRMDNMIQNGLFEEAQKFHALGHLPALQTVGYTEIFRYLDGEYDKEETVRLLKRNSRRYAKRQMTWFKKDEEFKWFRAGDLSEMIDYINDTII